MVMWAMKASLGYNGTWTAVLYSSCCCLCIGRWQFSLPLKNLSTIGQRLSPVVYTYTCAQTRSASNLLVLHSLAGLLGPGDAISSPTYSRKPWKHSRG